MKLVVEVEKVGRGFQVKLDGAVVGVGTTPRGVALEVKDAVQARLTVELSQVAEA